MFHGLSTVTLYAPDLEEAGRWYTEALGIEPYYVTPAYIEFHIGPMKSELGFIKAAYAGSPLAKTPAPVAGSPAGAVANWHVDDVAAERERLIALGASPHDDVVERGEGAGYVTASVIDPFGNVLGLIHNPPLGRHSRQPALLTRLVSGARSRARQSALTKGLLRVPILSISTSTR